MNVALPPKLETFVRQKVKEGHYHTASEVVREGLRMLQEADSLRQARLDALRKEISLGLEDVERGKTLPFDPEKAKERLRKRLASQKKNRPKK